MITISDAATNELFAQSKRRCIPPTLRLGIISGGCNGFSYSFEWTTYKPHDDDEIIDNNIVRVYVDKKSILYLDGFLLDFVSGVTGHGFKFINPNVKSSCGCGKSIQL